MGSPPEHPKIYHITHVDNLATIIRDGCLRADREMIRRRDHVVVGMQSIKARRLGLPVRCHPGDFVADYVPFYFCPRSVMLYILYRANHPEITYRGGQGPIVHLEADLREVVAWAEDNDQRWAFSLSNAGANYTEWRADMEGLGDLDWSAIAAVDWRDSDVREGKQAEFLVHGTFPFHLIRRIGVITGTVGERVEGSLTGLHARPAVTAMPSWYY